MLRKEKFVYPSTGEYKVTVYHNIYGPFDCGAINKFKIWNCPKVVYQIEHPDN